MSPLSSILADKIRACTRQFVVSTGNTRPSGSDAGGRRWRTPERRPAVCGGRSVDCAERALGDLGDPLGRVVGERLPRLLRDARDRAMHTLVLADADRGARVVLLERRDRLVAPEAGSRR